MGRQLARTLIGLVPLVLCLVWLPAAAAAAEAFKRVGDQLVVGNNATGERCRLRLVADSPERRGTQRYGLYCDGWSAASGEIRRIPASGDYPPARLLTDSAHEKALARRVGGCAPVETTTLADGSAAVVRECKRLDGGWRVVVLATTSGKWSYLLETFPTNLRLLELATEILKGRRPPEDAGRREPVVSAAIRRAETMLEPGGQLAAVADVGARAELYPLGRRQLHAGHWHAGESTFRRLVAIEERVLGPNHPESGRTLSYLGFALGAQEKYAESDAVFGRAEPLIQKSLAAGDMSAYLADRANVERMRGRLAEALRYGEEAVRLRDADGPGTGLAEALVQTGRVYRALRRFDDAERLFLRALGIADTPGPDPEYRAWRVGETHHDLGVLYLGWNKLFEARRHLELALKRRRLLFGDSLKAADTLRSLGRLGRAEGDLVRSLEAWRAVGQIETLDPFARERARPEGIVEYLQTIFDRAASARDDREALAVEAFAVAQIPRSGETAKTIANMAARLSTTDAKLQAAVRAYQETERERDRLRVASMTEQAREPIERDPDREASLGQRLRDAAARATSLEQALQAQFPLYTRLTAARPVPASEVAALLRPGEAMLVVVPTRRATWVLLLRDGIVHLHRSPLTTARLATAVKALRAGLDLGRGDVPRFDAAAAHSLWAELLAPLRPALDGVTHLVTVPGGALQSLPLGVLVTAPPRAADIELRDTVWLAHQMAISVVPTVAAFRDVRAVAGRSAAPHPFVGFGDPLFAGPPGDTRNIGVVTAACRDRLADVEIVRALPALPETAPELRRIAEVLGAPAESVILGARASEATVRATDLRQYRVIAFATHGILPAELKCRSEPALALTPPATATDADDGLLDSSEIARLSLDADWVVLSACNTAAPDGRLAGESLSGLARAFFFAGARALLVSHWAVASVPTTTLTTELFGAYSSDSTLGRAEALRRAQAVLRTDPATAHPAFWAPFVLVGDGGARP